MKLLLAVDIADRIAEAAARRVKPDLSAMADELLSRHPEAHASRDDIMGVLADESRRLRRGTATIH